MANLSHEGQPSPTEPIKAFPAVEDFLAQKSITLANDYRTPDGQYSEHCGLLAVDVARLLIEAGAKPSLLALRGETVNTKLYGQGWWHDLPLEPKQYDGRVSWGGHTVCSLNGTIYDPMVGKPMEKDQYIKETFDALVFFWTIVGPDEIEEFVKRGEKQQPYSMKENLTDGQNVTQPSAEDSTSRK